MKKVILWIVLATILSAQTFKCHDLMTGSTEDDTRIVQAESTVEINKKTASVTIAGIGTFYYTFKYVSPNGITSFNETKGMGYLAYNKLTPDLMLLGEGISIGQCTETKKASK